jgi:hypothetical protein
MSADEFCFRACVDGPEATTYCQHTYDEMGCEWNMPGNYDIGSFTSCQADNGAPMGVYGGTSTWDSNCQHTACAGGTPPAQDPPSSSLCSSVGSISNQAAVAPTATATGPYSFNSAAAASSNSVALTASSSSMTTSRVSSSGASSSSGSHSGSGTVSVTGSASGGGASPSTTARGAAGTLTLPVGTVFALGGVVLGMLML